MTQTVQTPSHYWLDPKACPVPAGKVVCVGRNYVAHAQELGHAVPDRPLLFMKPREAIRRFDEGIDWPEQEGCCHHETELTVLVGASLCKANADQARDAVAGIGVGLDLTLRDLQDRLKKAGHPWERAKAFDGSAVLSPFIPVSDVNPDWQSLKFGLIVNGMPRQSGDARLMLTPIIVLLVEISAVFTLMPGDVVMTGTPEGVAALQHGDQLELQLDRRSFRTWVRQP